MEDWSRGRSSAFLVLVLLCSLTTVLTLSYWMTRSNTHNISLASLYAWETILYLFSMATIMIFTILKNNEVHVVENSALRTREQADTDSVNIDINTTEQVLPKWAKFPLRRFVITICCVGSTIIPAYATYRSIANILCLNSEASKLVLILKCGRSLTRVLFCICQAVFLICFKNKVVNSPLMKVMIAGIVSANYALCVDVVLNVIWMSSTLDLKTDNNNLTSVENETNEKLYMYLKCSNNTLNVDTVALYFYKYSYQFPIEFASLSFCYLGIIWNVFAQAKRTTERNSSICSNSNSNNDSQQELLKAVTATGTSKWRRIRKAAVSTFVFCCDHTFILASIFVTGIFTFHLFTEITVYKNSDFDVVLRHGDNNKTHSGLQNANSILQTVDTYVLCIIAFIGFLLVRKEKPERKYFSSSDVLLLVVAASHLLLILFETIDPIDLFIEDTSETKTATKVLYFIKTIFHYIGVYSQTVLVIKASKLNIRRNSIKRGKQLFIKSVIVFIGMYNAERWVVDRFLPPTILMYVSGIHNDDIFGEKNWWFIVEILFPLVIVYRILTAVMCYETCVRLKRKVSVAN